MIDSRILQSVLNEEIPISLALGIKVEQLDDHSISLSAPLLNNINHKSTAFGGSLYSIAVLSGWGLIYTILNQHHIHAHIVIQQSEISYINPVNQDFTAHCEIDSQLSIEKMMALYKRKGISRVSLEARIYNQEQIAVKFKGKYVIHR